MKFPVSIRRFLFVSLFTFFAVSVFSSAQAATYYLAPTGNDNNACTLAAPCFTLERAWQLVAAGDTVYMRGGDYRYTTQQDLNGKNGTAGNMIKVWAYPGEKPNIRGGSYVFNINSDQDLISFTGNYVHFKDLEISYFEQTPNQTPWFGFRSGDMNNCIIENINYHHNGSAFTIRGNSTGNLILNSDFHHNKDPYSDTPYDGADGLAITFNYDPSSVNTIRGSRAYWNADDGFDTWENAGHVIIENSWSFYNGYIPDTFTAAGNGTAFKLGSISTPSSQTKRTLKNNLAYKNRFAGFVENNAGVKMELYNNTSVNAGYTGYWFGAWGGNGNVTIAKNNLDYLGTNAPGPFNSASTITNNSWQNNITVTNADFANMTDSQLVGARKADGSLPDITFLSLAAGSDLINAGTPISGMSYVGSAPDIGAFEYGGTTTPPSTTFTIGQRVQVTATTLNVRATASATGTLLGTQANGALGTVTAGPTAADGYVWWNINYDTGVDGWSAESFLTAYTAPAPDTTAPTVPTNLTGTGTTNTVALSWTASTDNVGVTGYRIFRSSTSTGTYTQIGTATTTSYTDTGLTASTTYYYKVSAYDAAGNSSAQTAAKSVATTAGGTAGTYYLSPTGNDNNPCTLAAPCFTLQKAWTLVAAGDTVYLRGGTYIYTKQQGLTGKNGTAGNLIKVWAYPGETPIITRSATGYTTDIYWHRSGIFFTGNYVHFKGLEITGYKNISGNIESALLGYDASNNIFEQLNIHHNHHGLYLENNSGNNLILNSDFHDNYDTQGNGGNSDGVGVSYNIAANNVIDGCRSWNNGDDGFDTFEHKGLVTIKNSWAWHNGYVYGTTTPAGDGVGFKLGSNFLQGTSLQNTVVRIVQNTISADNRNSGYHINEGDHRAVLYNNVSYANGIMGLNFHWNNLVHTFKNNVSFGNGNTQVEVSANSVSTNNSYGIGGYSDGGAGWAATASTADFVSVDVSQLARSRNADGSLPSITAFTLAAGSDLINAGTNVGLPYNGSAPDIGAFESTGTSTAPDTTAPTTPTNLTTMVMSSSAISLTWTASTDNVGVVGYRIFRSSTLNGTYTQIGTAPTAAGYSDTGLTASTTYYYKVSAYDAAGNSSAQTAAKSGTTTVNGTPVANAGVDQTITLPTNSVTLSGSGTDTGGWITAYAWTKVSTLAGTITTPTSASTTVTGLAQGTHTFRLTVTDNGGLTATDDVVVTVNATTADTTAPTVPTTLTGTGTTNTVALSWTASTDNVGVTGYRIFRSTTSTGTYTQIGTSTTPSYTDTGLTASTTYYYKVSAYDAAGNSSAQTAAKSVATTAAANQAPTANAGADKTITLPTNSVTLTGSGTDTDGTIASYAWTKVSGGSATITSPSSATTTITGLTQGTYSFWLTVTDNAGATNADAVVVTVNAAPVTANQINVSGAINDAGYAYRISQSFGIPADIASSPFRSTLRVFENGVELTQAHADHVQIESTGLGRFSHWMDENGYEALYLSTTDNTDPRTNGRTYTFRTDGTAGSGGGGSSGFSDNFNRANSTSLGTSWTERYGASNFRINANRLQLNVNDTGVSSAHTTTGITSANYTVSSKISFPNTNNLMYAGISGRRTDYGATDSNGYMAFVEIYDQLLTLYKRVDGQWVRLGEYNITLPANTFGTIGLSMNGSTIEALWNGTSVISVSDSTFSGAGSAGAITGTDFPMTGVRWDDFSITP